MSARCSYSIFIKAHKLLQYRTAACSLHCLHTDTVRVQFASLLLCFHVLLLQDCATTDNVSVTLVEISAASASSSSTAIAAATSLHQQHQQQQYYQTAPSRTTPAAIAAATAANGGVHRHGHTAYPQSAVSTTISSLSSMGTAALAAESNDEYFDRLLADI